MTNKQQLCFNHLLLKLLDLPYHFVISAVCLTVHQNPIIRVRCSSYNHSQQAQGFVCLCFVPIALFLIKYSNYYKVKAKNRY